MLKWIESTGKTETAAIQAALDQLGLDRDDVKVEVLERAKSGFLGIGSCPAKVKVTYEVPDEPQAAEVSPVVEAPVENIQPEAAPAAQSAPVEEVPAAEVSTPSPAPAAQSAPVEEVPAAEVSTPSPAAVESDDAVAARITEFLTGLFSHMGAEARPVITVDERGCYEVELVGEHLGSLIGRRGETLDAIQQLTVYAVNRNLSHRVRIHVDAEGYRAKREESLVRLARKVAGKVVRYRRNVTLEPMNAYERHVIHTALQDYPDVTTYSVGTEPNRRTVVAYEAVARK